MKRYMRICLIAAGIVIGLTPLLVSCGSNDSYSPPDPLAAYNKQVLDWQVCGGEFRTALGPVMSGVLDTLGAEATCDCAYMNVPLDYNNSAKGDLKIALLRVRAKKPQQHLGSILFNPGGPGQDGLVGAVIFGKNWSGADTADPVAALYKKMFLSYDLIGFSPRGTGASTNLSCLSELYFKLITSPSVDPSDENYNNVLYNAQLVADTCKPNPMTPYINSDTTSRDMDLIRHLVGDSKLNYIGYSYGTWLGTWYAGLFPDRVGRMLLIGMTDITQSLDATFLPQEMAMQRVLDEVLVPYAARHSDRFSLGTTAREVRQAYLDLRSAPGYMMTVLQEQLQGLISKSGEADRTLWYLRAAHLMNAYLVSHPGADEAAVTDWISGAQFVSDPVYNATARDLARNLKAVYFSKIRNELETATLTGTNALTYTVICNDSGTIYGKDDWLRASRSSSALYPVFGGFWAQNACIYWGGATVSRPPTAAVAKAGPIMIVQSEQDPWTPREGALRSLTALPNAGMIEVLDEYSHGLYPPYGVACVDKPVAEYFLYGTAPERMTYCQGKPLPADAD